MPGDQRVVNVVPNEKAVVAVVQCREFDHAKTEQLKDQMATIAADSPGRPVLVDLSNVEFMASATLGALVQLRNALSSDGRRLVLVGVAPEILKVMEFSALQNLFEFHNTVETALG